MAVVINHHRVLETRSFLIRQHERNIQKGMLNHLYRQTVCLFDQLRLQHFLWISHGFNFPRDHQGNPVRVMGCQIQVMQRDQYREVVFVSKFVHQFQSTDLVL